MAINVSKSKTLCYARYEKPLKTTLYKWKKYVETYFSSNAAAQDPEERVTLKKP